MRIKQKKDPSEEGKLQMEALRQAVCKTLEKKHLLGQYSVIWRDGQPVAKGDDFLTTCKNTSVTIDSYSKD
ncbi:MAG: hypothetical protein VW701_18880 [Deltaproteobacteria bacterium]